MPSIEELRRWLAGESVEGLADRQASAKPSPIVRHLPSGQHRCDVCEGEGSIIAVLVGGKQEVFECPQCKGEGAVKNAPLSEEMRAKAEEAARRRGAHGHGGKYSISVDGGDAVLLFGKHNGECISQLAKSFEGRGYLEWMLKQEFAPHLLNIVRFHMDATRE